MAEKKICFISLGNLYLTPYIKKYEQVIKCEYDIIYWNRHHIQEKSNANELHPFNYSLEEGGSIKEKLEGYLKFRKFAKQILAKNGYNGIVLLQTSCGILLVDTLVKKYNKRYIVDIRDYTKENNKLFYYIEKYLFKHAARTIISSTGYKAFLPPNDYTVVHNDITIDSETIQSFRKRDKSKEKIIISYIGLVRFHEECKKVINHFKNDDRFELRFIGKGATTLEEYCTLNNIHNVKLTDRFLPEQTLEFYRETDIIYNLYGNNTPLLDYALSNKLYYAAKLGIPILVSPQTCMEKEAVGNGFGFSVNVEEVDSKDNLYRNYQNIDWERLNQGCDQFLEKVDQENKLFNKRVKQFINEI